MFDGEELLEGSIKSIRSNVDYVVVVYQKISNFGDKCNPKLESLLRKLVEENLVDEMLLYQPSNFSSAERKELVSKSAPLSLQGANADTIGEQFFNELRKRELGREKCAQNGCTHFMSIDTDEFYLNEELARVKQVVEEKDYDATACRMRLFVKKPTWEFFPYDNINAVPLICKISKHSPFRLAAPFQLEVDPTRRIENIQNFCFFDRSLIEMSVVFFFFGITTLLFSVFSVVFRYHFTLVRIDIRKKVSNVSNKANYEDVKNFVDKFEDWKIDYGVLHPHPLIGAQFTQLIQVPNYFKIDLDSICVLCYKQASKRCLQCKSVRYCSKECQQEHWPLHKQSCTKK